MRHGRWVLFAALAAALAIGIVSGSISNPGMIRLYGMERLTIVYPAGDDDGTALRSAERRAAYLRSAYDVDVRVVADDRLDDEARSGDLLLLGWDNRALGGDGDPERPYSRVGSGMSFLGLVDRDPRSDLTFCHNSPFDPERALCFWSRIDPELDRIMVLPAVGSDWAVLRDFQVVAQGMFERNAVWPPKRNPNAEKDHRPELAETGARLQRHTTDHYDIVYHPEEIDRATIEAIATAREKALRLAKQKLQRPDMDTRIRVYVYPDEETKERRFGLAGEVHSIPRSREIHVTTRLARSGSPHEEIHLLARVLYGMTPSTALYEGLSYSYDETFSGTELGVHGAMMLEHDALPTVEQLLDEEALRALPDMVAFPGSGLLLTWVREIVGLEAVAKAYALEDPTAGSLAEVLGLEAREIESAFRAWVVKVASKRNDDVAFLKAQQEAADAHLRGDFEAITRALEKALKHRPGDHQTIFNLAAARMRIGEYEAAEAELKALIADETLPQDHTLHVFAHYQLGRLYDVLGRREEAIERYRRVLELPDLHDSHQVARDALETPVTLDSLR